MYCHVVNGVPKPPQNLPEIFENVSNFHVLPPEELAKHGWFPFVPGPEPKYYKADEKQTRKLIVHGNEVHETVTIEPLSDAEKAAFNQARFEQIEAAIMAFLDRTVSGPGHRDFLSTISWANSKRGLKDKAKEAIELRDECWLLYEQTIAGVATGKLPLPEVEEFMRMMGQIVHPHALPQTANGTLTP